MKPGQAATESGAPLGDGEGAGADAGTSTVTQVKAPKTSRFRGGCGPLV
jgi:hypothetical protein